MIARRIVELDGDRRDRQLHGRHEGDRLGLHGQGHDEPARGHPQRGSRFVREAFFNDVTDWYLFADPNSVPAFAIGFLNGERRPFIGLKNPEVRNALGPGVDPYTFELDSVDFKVRHGLRRGCSRSPGGVRSVVAG